MESKHHPHPGVAVRRRAFLRGALALPAMGVLTSWAQAHGRTQANDDAHASGDVAAFFEQWAGRAQAITTSESDADEAALHELCAGLARLDPSAFPGRKFDAYQGDGLTTGPAFFEGAFVVVELELEPGAVIPPHNHVAYDFVTLGVKGETQVRHFEPEQGAPMPSEHGKPFLLREVSSAVLTPGRTSTLTRTRANIHGFVAGDQGAKILDFGFHFPDPGQGPSTDSHLEIGSSAVDSGRRTFEAMWIGNIYARKDEEPGERQQ